MLILVPVFKTKTILINFWSRTSTMGLIGLGFIYRGWYYPVIVRDYFICYYKDPYRPNSIMPFFGIWSLLTSSSNPLPFKNILPPWGRTFLQLEVAGISTITGAQWLTSSLERGGEAFVWSNIMRERIVFSKFGWLNHQGTNISHLGKRKIIFKMPFLGDMLVPWRVTTSVAKHHFFFDVFLCWTSCVNGPLARLQICPHIFGSNPPQMVPKKI